MRLSKYALVIAGLAAFLNGCGSQVPEGPNPNLPSDLAPLMGSGKLESCGLNIFDDSRYTRAQLQVAYYSAIGAGAVDEATLCSLYQNIWNVTPVAALETAAQDHDGDSADDSHERSHRRHRRRSPPSNNSSTPAIPPAPPTQEDLKNAEELAQKSGLFDEFLKGLRAESSMSCTQLKDWAYQFDVTLSVCGGNPSTPTPAPTPTTPAPTPAITFAQVSSRVFQPRCIGCHGSLGTHSGTMNSGWIAAGNPTQSRLYSAVNGNQMPPSNPLSAADKQLISDWIKQGAKP